MKRKLILMATLIMILLLILFLGGCELPPTPRCDCDVDFHSRYERTDWAFCFEYNDFTTKPLVQLDSYEELNKYILSYDSWEHFGWWDINYQPIRPCYFTFLEGFNEEFFEARQLVIVRFVVGSGSIRHNVMCVKEDGRILIKTSVPGETMTMDMAVWSIIIELPQEIKPKTFSIEGV